MKTPKLTKDLERKPAKWMTTAEAAEALMRTLELKYCCCGQWMPWRLDAGQKPVGYVKPVVERELATSEVVESESANCAQQDPTSCTG